MIRKKGSLDPSDQLGLFNQPPEPDTPKSLSKSEFIAGWQCDKQLWFERHERETKKLDPMAQFLMQQGTAVGKLAQGLFSDAEFELKAEAGGVMAKADILRKNLLYEVKSSGYDPENPYKENKEEHLWDLALQLHVFEASGRPIEKAHLVLINKDFVRQGPIDPHAFFNIEDVTPQVRALLPQVGELLAHLKRVLDLPKAPQVDLGMHCRTPRDCPYQHRCYPELHPGHIFNLRMLYWRDKFRLFNQGVKSISDYAGKLDLWQQKQVAAFKSGEPLIDKPAIRQFLGGLKYPLYHLDFETCNAAIPPFDGLKPNRHMVFQYSLHIQDSLGAAPRHIEYLPGHLNDPREEMLDKLIPELGESGTILAYYSRFESDRLKELAEAFPRHKPAIDKILGRVVDLMTPFENGSYVHPAFGGSVSIKSVLPALVPTMSYKGMAIGEGTGAIRAYMEILDSKTSDSRRSEIRRDLRAYCKQDTLAMVEVLRVLESL